MQALFLRPIGSTCGAVYQPGWFNPNQLHLEAGMATKVGSAHPLHIAFPSKQHRDELFGR